MVVAAAGVAPITWSARVIVLNLQPGVFAPVPVASVPLTGSTVYWKFDTTGQTVHVLFWQVAEAPSLLTQYPSPAGPGQQAFAPVLGVHTVVQQISFALTGHEPAGGLAGTLGVHVPATQTPEVV